MNRDPESSPQKQRSKTSWQEVIDFFSSVQTAIIVLFLIAAASGIGALIPQDKTLEQLAGQMSPMAYKLTVILDLHRLFSSWWFILLLVILALQLLACLWSRWPRIVSDWRSDSNKYSFSFELDSNRPEKEIGPEVKSAISGTIGCSPVKRESNDQERQTKWIKHRIQELGFPMAHMAIIIIMLGGLIGMLYGFKGHISILEGRSDNVIRLFPEGRAMELPFQIHLEDFTLKHYESGAPKEFRSDLRLVKNGKTVAESYLLVNHPLTYDGISLYQSSYNLRGVRSIDLSFEAKGGQRVKVEAEAQDPVIVPGSDTKLHMMRLDPAGGSRPAVLEAVAHAPGKKPVQLTLIQNDPHPAELEDLKIRFLGYTPLYSSGIQVSYDPGAVLVWIGCGLLITGLFLTLFTNHRRVAALIAENQSGGSKIRISGRSKRSRKEFREAVTQAVNGAINKES
jgi:cytochrome c biogenesis protein